MSDAIEEKDLGNFNENELKDIMAEIENLENELNVDGSDSSMEESSTLSPNTELDDGANEVEVNTGEVGGNELDELDQLLNEETDSVAAMNSLQNSVEEDMKKAQMALEESSHSGEQVASTITTSDQIEEEAKAETNLLDFPQVNKNYATNQSASQFSSSKKIHFSIPKEVCSQFPVEISWGSDWSVNIDPEGKIYLSGPGGLNMVLQTAIVDGNQDLNKKTA